MRALIAVVALAGCGEDRRPSAGPNDERSPKEVPIRAIPVDAGSIPSFGVELKGFVDKMCACTDEPCATKVMSDLATWGQTLVTKYGKDLKPSPEDEKLYGDLGERLSECMAKATGKTSLLPVGKDPDKPLRTADEIISHTYANLGGFIVNSVDLEYVDANGVMDPTYGHANIELNVATPPDPADDPNRRLGAPVPDPVEDTNVWKSDCPTFDWKQGARTTAMKPCRHEPPLSRPKCKVAEVWKRAIAQGAPAQAIAKLSLEPGTPQRWQFTIEDKPRKFSFARTIPDTCDVILGAPPPAPSAPAKKPNPY